MDSIAPLAKYPPPHQWQAYPALRFNLVRARTVMPQNPDPDRLYPRHTRARIVLNHKWPQRAKHTIVDISTDYKGELHEPVKSTHDAE